MTRRNARASPPVLPAAVVAILVNLAIADRAQAQDDTGLGEIVVTAQRREQELQQAPVSVIVLSDEDLEARSITNLRELQNYVPNLTLAPQQNVGEGSGNIFIRGIGQEDFIAGAEPGVALYVDGIYVATTRGTLADLVDVERIEVMRGPQGTLFGKNSIGGAIQIVSKAPQPRTEGSARVRLGRFNRAEVRLVANTPLKEDLLLRVAVQGVRSDGYMDRLPPPAGTRAFTGLDLRKEGEERVAGGRLQLRWLADARTTVDLAIDATRRRNTQTPHRLEQLDPGTGVYPIYNRLIGMGSLPGPPLAEANLPHGFFQTYAAGANRSDLDTRGFALTAARDTGIGEIKLVAGHRSLDTNFNTDGDGLYFEINNTQFIDSQKQTTAELNLTGQRGGIAYSAGLFSLWQNSRSYPGTGLRSNGTLYLCGCYYSPSNLPVLLAPSRRIRSRSAAAYAQGTIDLTAGLRGTLGARVTSESVAVRSASILVDGETLLPTGVATDTGRAEDDWLAFTYRAALEWDIASDVMAYASVARGYKSGGFNVRIVPKATNLGLTSYDPEFARTFEIGIRSLWLDDRLRANATLFSGSYRNLQLRQQKIIDGIVTSQVDNAALARIRGLEAELEARPVPDLRLRASYGFLDAKYRDTGSVPELTLDSAFQRTPRHSLAASLAYDVDMAGGRLTLQGNYTYRSREQFQIVASPFDQEGYGLVSARAAWKASEDGWSVAVFGTNLLDEHYRVAGRGTVSVLGRPRQWGLEFGKEF